MVELLKLQMTPSATYPSEVTENKGETMDVTTHLRESTAVIKVSGKFDFSGHRAFREAAKLLLANAAVQEIDIDLSSTDYIDSAALGMLLLTQENADNVNKSVVLVRPTGSVKQVLDIANFHKLFAYK